MEIAVADEGTLMAMKREPARTAEDAADTAFWWIY
jgi:hypothetical protein